jgi:hypothetical protein
MSALGASDKRTVRGYRNELAKIGSLAIIDDGRQWVLYVNDPREASADRPKLTGIGPYRYFAFMQYQADDESGSFCAKAPAESPPGSFCAKPPDPELIDFSENLRRRQALEQERVAREAPPPAGDLFLQLARPLQERSNVLDIPTPSTLKNVPKNVLEHDGKNAKGEHEGAADRRLTAGERWHRERDLLICQLGRNVDYPWQPWAIVLIRHVGLIGEGEVAAIVAFAGEANIGERWAYTWGSVKKQLVERGAEACLATGLFSIADPTIHDSRRSATDCVTLVCASIGTGKSTSEKPSNVNRKEYSLPARRSSATWPCCTGTPTTASRATTTATCSSWPSRSASTI